MNRFRVIVYYTRNELVKTQWFDYIDKDVNLLKYLQFYRLLNNRNISAPIH